MPAGDETTIRTARCCCGGLQVAASGDPRIVLACHCTECQRRTGSVFGVGAYFRAAQITAHGESKLYVRDAREGRKLRVRFCPQCGSSVYWELDVLPGFLGVAVGAFADPQFPVPAQSLWEETRHPWLGFAHDPVRIEQQPPPRA